MSLHVVNLYRQKDREDFCGGGMGKATFNSIKLYFKIIKEKQAEGIFEFQVFLYKSYLRRKQYKA